MQQAAVYGAGQGLAYQSDADAAVGNSSPVRGGAACKQQQKRFMDMLCQPAAGHGAICGVQTPGQWS
jgi:hypothetical protein